jgi:hypothetical protein
MILSKDGAIYSFRFGLKGLIMFNDLLYLDEDEKLLIYFSGFITDQPNMTFQDVKALLNKCSESEINLLDNYINHNFLSKTPIEIEELYTRIVGEMGIAPCDFYQMTLQDINMAYEGFKRRKEIDANLFLIALKQRNNLKADIRLIEDKGYQIGSSEERKLTFQSLNIKED